MNSFWDFFWSIIVIFLLTSLGIIAVVIIGIIAVVIVSIIFVIVAIIVGVIVGLPAVRIRGVQLAVVTVAFAISLQSLYFENQSLTQLSAGAPQFYKGAELHKRALQQIGRAHV